MIMIFSVQTSTVRKKRPNISMRLNGGFGFLGHRLEEEKNWKETFLVISVCLPLVKDHG